MYTALFSRDDILSQLDTCTNNSCFPILDHGYVYLADTRLSAYGNTKHWALMIEILGVDVRWGEHKSIENRIYCFGNCLQSPPGTPYGNIIHPTADGPEGSTFLETDVMEVDQRIRTLRIRNQVISINPDPTFLATRGIKLVDPPAVMAADLLRYLTYDYREHLLANDEELQQRMPYNLPPLLRLDVWNHPNVLGNELPSDSETFQMLADVFVTGDSSRYCPHLLHNTHWSHWPDGGTL